MTTKPPRERPRIRGFISAAMDLRGDRDESWHEQSGGKKDFEPPTVEEVIEFFKSKDFPEQLAREFHEYYALGDWKDKNGNQVKQWKQKAVSVWLKSDRKEKKQPQTQDSEFRF